MIYLSESKFYELGFWPVAVTARAATPKSVVFVFDKYDRRRVAAHEAPGMLDSFHRYDWARSVINMR